ncbi:MAG: hypothetical protein AAGL96_16160 [Pseudomonadota bacterium]
MKTTTRRRALSLLTASSALALVPAPTLLAATEDPFEGGIGGTGIVGVMTGRGSLFINGLRVEIPDGANLTLNGIPVSEDDLLPGVAMTVVAEAREDRFVAARVDAEHPLIGMVADTGGVIKINGAPIVMDPGARTAPVAGQRMAASGVWRADGALQTSLIQPVSGTTDRIAGTVTDAGQIGMGRIGLTEVAANGLKSGEYAAILGRYENGIFVAQRVQNGRFRAGTALDQLSVEGYLEPVSDAPGFRIAGLGHSFARSLDLRPYAARRSVFFGRYAGLFVARRAVAVPERQGARRRLLTPDSDAARAAGLARARRIDDR